MEPSHYFANIIGDKVLDQPLPPQAPHFEVVPAVTSVGWRFLEESDHEIYTVSYMIATWICMCVHVFWKQTDGEVIRSSRMLWSLFWLGYVQTWNTKNTDLWCNICNDFFISFSILFILDSLRHCHCPWCFSKDASAKSCVSGASSCF